MWPTLWKRLASVCVTATLGGCLGFGNVEPANVSGQCRALGNELARAVERSHVDEVFEGGVEAGCWTRTGR